MSLKLSTPVIGANVDDVRDEAQVDLGTVLVGVDGTKYVYVQAAASLMASALAANAVAIDEDYQANLMTSALGAAGQKLGFAPEAVIADDQFFFARIGGSGFRTRLAASTAADVYLRTTTTAGVLSGTSTASAVAFPVVAVSAAGASFGAGFSKEVLAGDISAIRVGLASLP